MNTLWHNTLKGRQYWVQVKSGTLTLELSSDPVSELVGGGYSYDLPHDIEANADAIQELKNIFGEKSLGEILAFARALKQVSLQDFETRSDTFNRIYFAELEKLANGS